MKFNFWQMLGAVLLAGGAALMIYRQMNKPSVPNPNPAITQPSK